jgi:uncharacterized phiE125 gp8 family phage protein
MTSLQQHGVKWHLTVGASTDVGERPVDVHAIKQHLNIDHDDDDSLLAEYVDAAEQIVRKRIRGGGELITQTITLVADAFPPGEDRLELPLSPCSSVTSVTYFSEANVSTAMASSDYQAFTPADEPGFLRPAVDAVWPATKDRTDAVTVVYAVGRGSLGSDCPPAARQAIRMLAGQYYHDRDGCADPKRAQAVQMCVDTLLDSVSPGFYG